jgi:hypothetical protein
MTRTARLAGQRPRSRHAWRTAWPSYLLGAFIALALDGALPAGPARALLAVPLLLAVPGALTIGALLSPGRTAAGRVFEPATFCCLAAVLSVVWLAFAALLLNAVRVRITALSEYLCLLAVCALLAAAAQARLRRANDRVNDWASDAAMDTGAADVLSTPAEGTVRSARAGWYTLAAVAAGVLLLAGAGYGYAHTPRPSAPGYTWLAWTGVKTGGVIAVGPSGRVLPFQIRHQQPGTAEFRLTAAWIGAGRRHQLAGPVNVRIGPDKTFHGTLSIPRPPGGCAYRVQVTLTELAGTGLARTGLARTGLASTGLASTGLASTGPLTLSINVDVRAAPRPGSGAPPRGCAP